MLKTSSAPSAPPYSRGFTLLELLVVIGVIGVLMGLLLPSLSGARRNAKTMKCAANFRALGLAFREYGIENNDSLFRITWTSTPYYTQVRGYSTIWYAANDPSKNIDSTTAPYHDVRWILADHLGDSTQPGVFPRATPSSTLSSFKPWICPFVADNVPALDATGPSAGDPSGASYLNYDQSRLWVPSTNVFFLNDGRQGTATQVEKFFEPGGLDAVPGGGGAWKGSFPLKISQAPSGLPMAQDAYGTEGRSVAGAWVINHLASPAFVPATNAANPSAGHNETLRETDGLGANIVFYDGSVRFVPRGELIRTDKYAGDSQYLKSILRN